ncbi:deoxyribonuclease-1-like [Styela clava]|uniref:deoxyribonuclease-1-like n=1 Tax=Styela clava TaxID=7725 RepID=UPI0019398194|nr:deoxyribonuclease-1-like [Styela clava]XP_039274464.1 deoxyribonuclease-1-like [Styela clava]
MLYKIILIIGLVSLPTTRSDDASQKLESDLLIGTFNIQVLGRTKIGKREVVDVLVEVLNRYDLVGVLEIRDSSQTAFAELVQSLNEYAGGDVFEFFTGRRTGRSSSKEQTGFIYRTEKLDVVSMYERFDEYDVLEREPTIARFKRVQPIGLVREFTFIPIHIKPDDAVAEMNSLLDVCDEAERTYGENIIVAGDLNADCSYVPKSKWEDCQLRQSEDYQWMISDEEDTTTKKTNCAYDRIILRGKDIKENSCCARVYRFDQEMQLDQELVEDVSDHFPVEFILS